MRPVFIGGCERSGTTVLGAILGMHSKCVTIPEAYFKVDLFQAYASEGEDFSAHNYLNRLREEKRFKLWNMEISSTSNSTYKLSNDPASVMEYIVNEYSESIGKPLPKIWIDHTPRNLAHVLTLLNFFPEAKMIHIVRDGRAVASSVLPLDWGPNSIEEAAYWWLQSLAFGLISESTLNNTQIIRVHYEDLVGRSEQTVKRLCEFLGLNYQPSMLKAAGFQVPKYTIKQHSLVGKKLDNSRINAWETKLNQKEIEVFERITGNLLEALNYSMKYGDSAHDISDLERQIFRLKSLFRKIKNRFRRSFRMQKAMN